MQIRRINNAVQTCPQQYSLYLSLLKVWEEKLQKARYLNWENCSHAFVPILEAGKQSCCAFPQTTCWSSGKLQVICYRGLGPPLFFMGCLVGRHQPHCRAGGCSLTHGVEGFVNSPQHLLCTGWGVGMEEMMAQISLCPLICPVCWSDHFFHLQYLMTQFGAGDI